MKLIPEPFLDRSGSVFLSGRRAFNSPSELYILGLNPAGDSKGPFTISKNIDRVLHREAENWSEVVLAFVTLREGEDTEGLLKR